jgi:hypothetical protein
MWQCGNTVSLSSWPNRSETNKNRVAGLDTPAVYVVAPPSEITEQDHQTQHVLTPPQQLMQPCRACYYSACRTAVQPYGTITQLWLSRSQSHAAHINLLRQSVPLRVPENRRVDSHEIFYLQGLV